MAHGSPAQTTIYDTRPRLRPLGLVLALLLIAGSAIAAWNLVPANSRPLPGGSGVDALAAGRWPEQGQAALVVGDGTPAASPGQQEAPIASLAKVMTAYLTLERDPIGDGEEGFTMTVTPSQARDVAEEAEEGQSVVPVEAGERLSERQMLEALLIPSGNNIARMLASREAGGEAAFVDQMNAEAEELGMDDTTYTDPSGFDPSTVSTAADQLRVFGAAIGFPAFRQIVSMGEATLPVAGTVTNFNPLLGAGFAGKTGSDSAAGGCLSFFTRVTVGGHPKTAIGVVMGQGEGSDTTDLLAAAAEAAEGLVGSGSGPVHGSRGPRGDPIGGAAAPPLLPARR